MDGVKLTKPTEDSMLYNLEGRFLGLFWVCDEEEMYTRYDMPTDLYGTNRNYYCDCDYHIFGTHKRRPLFFYFPWLPKHRMGVLLRTLRSYRAEFTDKRGKNKANKKAEKYDNLRSMASRVIKVGF